MIDPFINRCERVERYLDHHFAKVIATDHGMCDDRHCPRVRAARKFLREMDTSA